MFNLSRRGVLVSAAMAAAFGLAKPLALIADAHAETPVEPSTGFYKYKVGIDRSDGRL